MKQRTTAGIFALLLGGFGIHRFYVGDIVLGFLYLLFCWTLIPALLAFIDGLIWLTQTDEIFNLKYNKS